MKHQARSSVGDGASSVSNKLQIIFAVLAGGVAIALIAWTSDGLGPKAIIGTGGSELSTSPIAPGLKVQPGLQLDAKRIVPAHAEGPSSTFFVGTGDGGNGFHTH